MKILLSAYACEPNRGSEPGVGWKWAHELQKRGHIVWVITRKNNRASIENAQHLAPDTTNLINFIYYDPPRWLTWWKKGGRGVYLFYLLWQIGVIVSAKKIHKKEKFDLVHHITFGVIRQPSFMGLLGIPFILGPLGGGERAPYKLRKSYPLKGKILDFLRDILNFMVKFDPLMHITFFSADKIYTKTNESLKVIPIFYRKKAITAIEIGSPSIKPFRREYSPENINILFVGRFIYWKGGHLAIRAFKEFLKQHPNAKLTMVGQGPQAMEWKKLAETLDINENIIWIDWVEQKNLFQLYQENDIFLFPSLHDSSGNVVLESMSFGLPVVCLNLGGPGELVSNESGIKVNIDALSEDKVIEHLNDALTYISKDEKMLRKFSEGAFRHANSLSWSVTVSGIYEDI